MVGENGWPLTPDWTLPPRESTGSEPAEPPNEDHITRGDN